MFRPERYCGVVRGMTRTKYGAKYGVMDASKDIEPITTLKRDAAELIARAKERQSPIVITQNGKPAAVLQDVAAYERQRQALLLLKLISQGEQDYEAGRTKTSRQARARIRKRLAKHR